MSKNSQSLILCATSIFCACVVAMLFPSYVSDVRNLHEHMTFTRIDWRMTARKALAFAAASFLLLAIVICAFLAYKQAVRQLTR